MKRPRSALERRFLGAMFLLLAASALAGGAAFRYQQLRAVKSQIELDLDAAANVVRNVVSEKLNDARNVAVLLGEDPRMGRLTGAGAAEEELARRLENLPVDYITLIDRAGAVVAHVTRDGRKETRLEPGLPLFLDPVFRAATQAPSASGLELCRENEICATAVARIRGARFHPGYVRTGYRLDDAFAASVSRLTQSEFIILRKGQTLASSAPGVALGPALQASLTRGAEGHGDAGRIETFQIAGRPLAFGASLLRDSSGGELGVEVVGRDASAAMDVNKRAFLTFAAMTAALSPLTFLLAFWLARALLKPLNLLTGRVERFGRGEWEDGPELRGNDEISQLARAFDRMAREVKERNDRLREQAEEIKRNQDRLIQSGKLAAIGELAAGVAHEIGNPLSVISGYAQALRRRQDASEEVKRRCAEIEKESEFIENIIQDLLDFARPARDATETFDLREALDDALGKASNHKSFRNVTVCREYDGRPAPIAANRREIVQGFVNLAINAAQAMPEGGLLHARALIDEGRGVVRAELEDEGPGIPPDRLDRVFDPFFTTKPPGEGTGLGLTITYRIVEKSGGRIRIDSSPGRGTRAVLEFPVAPRENAPPDPETDDTP